MCEKEVKAKITDTSVHCPRGKVNQVFRAAEPALGERVCPCVYLAGARVRLLLSAHSLTYGGLAGLALSQHGRCSPLSTDSCAIAYRAAEAKENF